MTLDIKGLVVEADGERLLTDISLHVPQGRRFAVLGPSGAGKSTLLRAIAGLVPIAGGSIAVSGRDVSQALSHRRGVGMMFQEGLLFPHLDVAGNVGFGPRMRKQESPERTDWLLELVGLSGFGKRKIGSLSGGEKQRVALARALATEPEVLLLDEPFSSLDIVLTQRLLADVRSLTDTLGTTVLAVTHDPVEASAIADTWVVMSEGRLLQVGSPQELRANPADGLVELLTRQIG